MTELTTAPTGAPLADGDIFLVRKAGEAGAKQITAEEAKEYFGAGGGGDASFPPFVDNAGKVLAVNEAEDGVEWIDASAAGGTLYRFGGFFVAEPEANEVVMLHVTTDAFTLPENFAGAKGSIGTPPSADVDFAVTLNGDAIGSITMPAAGAVSFATDAGAVEVAAGDVLAVTAPADSLGAASGAFTFRSLYTAIEPTPTDPLPAVVLARTMNQTNGSDVTLPWVPTVGNMLIAMSYSRSYPGANTGWTQLGISDGDNVNRIIVCARIVQEGDTADIQPTSENNDMSSLVVFEVSADYIPVGGLAGLPAPVMGRDQSPYAVPTISLSDKSFVLLGIGSQDNGVGTITIDPAPEDGLNPLAKSELGASYVHGGGAWFMGEGDFDVSMAIGGGNWVGYSYLVLEAKF